MNNPDHISESLETIFWVKIHKFFDAHPGSGIRDGKIHIRDGKNSDPGYISRIRNTGSSQCILWVNRMWTDYSRSDSNQVIKFLPDPDLQTL